MSDKTDPALPQAGGSYIREKDGTLTSVGETVAAPETPPAPAGDAGEKPAKPPAKQLVKEV